MKKIYIFFISLFFLYPIKVEATDFDINAKNAILYNVSDNEILYEKSADEKVSIASLTKIMTSIVAIEKIDDLNEYITITSKDFEGTNGYSKAGFKINDKVTYLDLLYGIILPSGADAVNAVVNNTYGYDEFINKMNELAKKLNLTSTSFSNPIGKDSLTNYSTAKDLSILLKYALKNETFKTIFTTKRYTTTNNIELKSTILRYANNKMDVNKIAGAKSGFTKDAGRCLASLYYKDNPSLIFIDINSSQDTSSSAINDTLIVYNYYEQNYSMQSIINDDTKITTIPINLSNEKTYEITGSEDITKYLKNDSNITYKYNGVKEIKFNTEKGTKLGTVSIYNKDKLLTTQDVYLESNIKYYPIKNIAIILITLLVLVFILIKKRVKK
ncbi:putative uncharacterized protein [Clostridium sp. CAG:609]|nr:putative uncharacterized protein [Clostridium sp. CAG:609]